METIKSYTDIEQSKKLAEILPLESADMLWGYYYNGKNYCVPNIRPFRDMRDRIPKGDTPAWSLSALLSVLPILDKRSPVISKTFDGKYRLVYHSTAFEKAIITGDYDNSIDACVVMIEKLHELNLL